MDEVHPQNAGIYETVHQVAAGYGAGPLLELPLRNQSRVVTPDSLIGALRHGLPLVGGFTGYPPLHERFLRLAVDGLLDGGDFADLVDMTHLRWVLLHPEVDWPSGAERDLVLHHPDLEPVLSEDGWDLLRIRREPRHPEWYAAIARGRRPMTSILGTPLVRLSAPAGTIGAVVEPAVAEAGGLLALRLNLDNRGTEAWPASHPSILEGSPVVILLRIVPAGSEGPRRFAGTPVQLWRDVPGGESLRMAVPLTAPSRPGRYRLESVLVQDGRPLATNRAEFEVSAPVRKRH